MTVHQHARKIAGRSRVSYGAALSQFSHAPGISVHPNVPGRNITRKGWFSGALVRTKVMGIAILTPEVVVAWAILQFRVAREVYLLGQYITFSIVSCRAYSEGSQTSSRTPYPYGHMGSTLSLRERNPFSDH